MLLEDPWECFLCRDKTKQPKDLILRPRLNWKEHFTKMFRTTPNFTNDVDIANLKKQNKAVRVLSLFDGLSTGKINLHLIYNHTFLNVCIKLLQVHTRKI